MITQKFNIYLHAGIAFAPVVHCSQYSQGETWTFTILDNDGSVYRPSSGALIGVKSDGNVIAGITGTVNSDGSVSIVTTQQLTAAAGRGIFELTIDGGTNGTANFIVEVEPKPTDGGVLSESDLSIIQQGINSVTPAVITETVSDYLSEHMTNPPIDPTLTVSNAAADAKVTGDEITDLKNAIVPVLGVDKFFDNDVLYHETMQKMTQTVNVSNTGFVTIMPTGHVFFDAVKGDKFVVLAKVRSTVSNDHQYVIRLRKYIGDTGTGTYYWSDTFTTDGISVVTVKASDVTKVELDLARKYTGSATTNFLETFNVEYLAVIKGGDISIWNDKAQATAENALTEIDYVRSTLLKEYQKTDITWERGYYSADGTYAGSTNSSAIRSAKTDYIQACAGSKIGLNNNINSTIRLRYCIYTEPTEEAFVSRLQVTSVNMATIPSDCYLRIYMDFIESRTFDYDEFVATLTPCLEMKIIQFKNANSTVIDGALSTTSENPVQNKVITQTIDTIRVPQTLPTLWQSKIEPVNTAKGDKFTFAIQTDTHYHIGYGDTSAYNLKILTNYVGFDFVANLGDVIRGYADETVDSPENMRAAFTDIMHRYVTGISCPLMIAMGNHDTNAMWANAYGGTLFTFAEVWGRMFRPSFNTNVKAVTQTGLMYYYTDFDDVRVIVLNTQDGANGGFGIGSDQLAWFTNTALDTDKWVLVMSHVPLVNGWSVSSNYVSSYANIVTALQNFKTNGGKVIGCMSGHTHTQENKTVDGILFVTFRNGADLAEVAMVDLENKTIDTIPVGFTGAGNRSFTFN